jgi:hypothetical protein
VDEAREAQESGRQGVESIGSETQIDNRIGQHARQRPQPIAAEPQHAQPRQMRPVGDAIVVRGVECAQAVAVQIELLERRRHAALVHEAHALQRIFAQPQTPQSRRRADLPHHAAAQRRPEAALTQVQELLAGVR